MKPNTVRWIAAGIFLTVMVAGCGGRNTSGESGENPASASSNQEVGVSDSSDDSMVTVPKEKADILEKYPELIAYLESENYQSAEAYIHELSLQKKKEAADDIEEYLVPVDLTSENFEDYFEFVTPPKFNAFGEPDGHYVGLKSKKYDEGLVVYSFDDITVEFSAESSTSDFTIDALLSFGIGGLDNVKDVSYAGRITDGKVTFIKKEYVENYSIPESEKPDMKIVEAEVQLKNGEEIFRYIHPDYPY